MPNIKSAIKRVSVTAHKELRNRMVKSSAKTAVKKFSKLLSEDVSSAKLTLSATTSAVDKAAAKGVMHKNAANRKKARLARAISRASV